MQRFFSGLPLRVGLSWGGRLVSLSVQILITPLLLHWLGDAHFSAYQVTNSLSGWFVLCSFSLGPALKNLVSEYHASGELDGPVRQTATMFVWGLWVGFTLVFGVAIFPLAKLLLGPLVGDDTWVVAAFGVSVLLMIVMGVGQVGYEALFADGRGQLAYLLPAAGQGVGLVLIYAAKTLGSFETQRLFGTLLLWFVPQTIAAVVALYMGGVLRVPHYDQAISLRLVKSALSFWGIALLSNGVLLIDYIVMSQFLPPSEIVLYSVMIGILNVLLLFYTSVLMVFWPEWSRYFLQGKIAQVEIWVLRSAILGVLGCVVLALGMGVALPDVLRLWLGRPTFTLPLTTILCFSSYLAIRVWTDTHAIALMSANQTRWLMLTVFLQMLVTLPSEIILGRVFGANGIVGGLIVGFVLTATWMLPYRFYQRR